MSAQRCAKNSFLCDQVEAPNEANSEFEALLDYLKYSQGYDLTGYKRSSLMRRFRHRMHSLQIESYEDYLQHLQSHSDEGASLLTDVLINVTCFFRDRETWNWLAREIIPQIIASKQPDEPIRIWSAGCATGQEVYGLLILLAEALGIEACLQRVQCFATDADKAALAQARQATYSDRETAGIPPRLRQKYFEETQEGYVFDPKLRLKVVFASHNILQDAPISKIDLLSCRNVLMYFNSQAQAAILARFHFALKNTGFLFLGKAETLSNRRQIFAPISLKHHVYTKGLELDLTDYLLIAPKSRSIDPTSNQAVECLSRP